MSTLGVGESSGESVEVHSWLIARFIALQFTSEHSETQGERRIAPHHTTGARSGTQVSPMPRAGHRAAYMPPVHLPTVEKSASYHLP